MTYYLVSYLYLIYNMFEHRTAGTTKQQYTT